MPPKFMYVKFADAWTQTGFVLKEKFMPKPKSSPKHTKVHAALVRAGRPAHVAAHVAKKACGKKR